MTARPTVAEALDKAVVTGLRWTIAALAALTCALAFTLVALDDRFVLSNPNGALLALASVIAGALVAALLPPLATVPTLVAGAIAVALAAAVPSTVVAALGAGIAVAAILVGARSAWPDVRAAADAVARLRVAEPIDGPLLRVAGVSVDRILDRVSLDVAAGEVVALIGTNGAGNTTLLRALAGELEHTGSIRLAGHEVFAFRAHRRAALGLCVIDCGALFDPLSVHESLALLGHQTPGGQRVGTLSGGERRLHAIRLAVARRPRVLLLDEPLRGLDADATELVIAALRELRDQGTAIVVVEQRLAALATLADRALFLESGRLQFDGDPAVLAARTDLLRPVVFA